jgi:hypothetical protein
MFAALRFGFGEKFRIGIVTCGGRAPFCEGR